MSTLIPGESLIYERDDKGNIYARYRDPPHNTIPRWRIGGPSEGEIDLKHHNLWNKIRMKGKEDPDLQKKIDHVILYYSLKYGDDDGR